MLKQQIFCEDIDEHKLSETNAFPKVVTSNLNSTRMENLKQHSDGQNNSIPYVRRRINFVA